MRIYQEFISYRCGHIAYAPERIGRINHLPMIMGIRGAYAIRPYIGTPKMGHYMYGVLIWHLILSENRIQ